MQRGIVAYNKPALAAVVCSKPSAIKFGKIQTIATPKKLIGNRSLYSNFLNIKNKELINYNRQKLYEAKKKDWELEQKIKETEINLDFESSIRLPDDDLNNWDDPL